MKVFALVLIFACVAFASNEENNAKCSCIRGAASDLVNNNKIAVRQNLGCTGGTNEFKKVNQQIKDMQDLLYKKDSKCEDVTKFLDENTKLRKLVEDYREKAKNCDQTTKNSLGRIDSFDKVIVSCSKCAE